ncbi:glycoside hydrolase family 2 TIM barrel-domain containing protein [Salinimicrobium gaetbulicola]|uniref:Glycoside hydrolase family 2 TIM barrel-domain containing protein n=1 Tax=Salinimicrobium gaetbulicola TaxID=999702 RepID=A0ABW3IIT4_9FLAO
MACTKPASTSNTSAKVYVAHDGNSYKLIRNNEPFQIKGAAGNSHFRELKEAGGNTIRVYDTINLKSTLDKAHEYGLAVIVDIPLPKYGDGSKFYEKDLSVPKKKIASLIRKFKDHPALLYWNLGNELYYPTFHKDVKFFSSYNSLVDLVKKTDPDHPVSTAVIGGNRRRLASILMRSPDLDLISINSFGNLTNLDDRMKPFNMIWNGPYVITEWGVNGPWEEDKTNWGAPIEQTSSKTSEILAERYASEVMNASNCMGSVVFFWGNKQERTHTWFSIFSEEGKRSESFHTLKNLWNNEPLEYAGPQIYYAYLNGRGSPESIILTPGIQAEAEVVMLSKKVDSLEYSWEIRPEAWSDIEKDQPVLKQLTPKISSSKIKFTTPQKEGPYRLFVYVFDKENNYSTSNIPFYVLNPANEE